MNERRLDYYVMLLRTKLETVDDCLQRIGDVLRSDELPDGMDNYIRSQVDHGTYALSKSQEQLDALLLVVADKLLQLERKAEKPK